MDWKKLKRKTDLEKFVYNGGDGRGRWDYIAIDNEGNWIPLRFGSPKPENAIIKADKGKVLACRKLEAKEKVRELEESFNGALRAQELRNEKI